MASMHFWGIEVKGKEPTSVRLEDGQVIHISQATLGELKKDSEPVIIHLKVGNKKLVMGVLSQNTPQLSFDLVIEQDFQISHNWKNGSVHFLGYDSEAHDEGFSDFSDDEEVPAAVPLRESGKPGASAAGKAPAQKAKEDNKAKPELKPEGDDDDSDDEDSEEEDSDDSDEEMAAMDSDNDDEDSDDEDDTESSEEEETPKPESGKKRPNPALVKTPEAKKAKVATPQKTDGKKGGALAATPHPSKKAGKSGEKPSPKLKSGGKFQSHNKAKHSK